MGGPHTSLLPVALGLSVFLTSCSFVEFERSPYAPRGFDVVYSDQEDLTFLVWRIQDDARLRRVHFELFIDGEFQPLDLADTAFPHEPFDCDRIYTCVQFQIPGRWEPPESGPALRGVDRRHGIFNATEPRLNEAPVTFAIDPIAIDNNRSVRPYLFDFFADEDIPLRRSFQWGMADVPVHHGCGAEGVTIPNVDFSSLHDPVPLPQGWSEDTPCMVVRPHRSDRDGDQVSAHLQPGPMLYGERIDEDVPVINHPTMIAFIADLQVVNESRCERIISEITSTIADALSQRPAPHHVLGTFRPLDQEGQQENGCSQNPHSTLPIQQIQAAIDQRAEIWDQDTTVVLVYLNNVELAPPNNHLQDLGNLAFYVEDRPDTELFTWLIASNTIRALYIGDEGVPWAPLEDDNFLPALESVVHFHFPLRTTDGEGMMPLTIPPPNAAPDPEYVRFCSHSPTIEAMVGPGYFQFFYRETWAWRRDIGITATIPRQDFVSFTTYRRESVLYVYEVCDAYCEAPFIAANGERYESWLDAERCQWR